MEDGKKMDQLTRSKANMPLQRPRPIMSARLFEEESLQSTKKKGYVSFRKLEL